MTDKCTLCDKEATYADLEFLCQEHWTRRFIASLGLTGQEAEFNYEWIMNPESRPKGQRNKPVSPKVLHLLRKRKKK